MTNPKPERDLIAESRKKKLPRDTIAESRSCPECKASKRGECAEHWRKRIFGATLSKADEAFVDAQAAARVQARSEGK